LGWQRSARERRSKAMLNRAALAVPIVLGRPMCRLAGAAASGAVVRWCAGASRLAVAGRAASGRVAGARNLAWFLGVGGRSATLSV